MLYKKYEQKIPSIKENIQYLYNKKRRQQQNKRTNNETLT